MWGEATGIRLVRYLVKDPTNLSGDKISEVKTRGLLPGEKRFSKSFRIKYTNYFYIAYKYYETMYVSLIPTPHIIAVQMK
jgi:hypothetical protein